MTARHAPSVSVVVPVRNGRGQLPLLLEALERQTLPRGEFEVIVADDRSDDGTPGLVREHGLARVIDCERRGGSYAARNRALAEVRADVIAFTDADCVPAPDWLERGLATMAEPGTDLVAGHIEIPLGGRPSAAALIDCARHLDQARAVREGFGATANLWARREVVENVGGFNAQLISGGDTEFGHRARRAGASLRYAPEVRIVHPPRDSARELARKAYRLGYGAAQQRHHADSDVLRARKRIYARPGAYKPRMKVYGIERLERDGHAIGRRRRLAMAAIGYVCVQLPIAAGNWAGHRAERGGGDRPVGTAEPTPAGS
jgi:glycosyltransferase involved in cell wall biosynthesis